MSNLHAPMHGISNGQYSCTMQGRLWTAYQLASQQHLAFRSKKRRRRRTRGRRMMMRP